jgi:hypothetical protein
MSHCFATRDGANLLCQFAVQRLHFNGAVHIILCDTGDHLNSERDGLVVWLFNQPALYLLGWIVLSAGEAPSQLEQISIAGMSTGALTINE